jgi:hypothetical protein
MLPQNHQEIDAWCVGGRTAFRRIYRRILWIRQEFQGRQLDRSCLKHKSVALVLNDTPDQDVIYCGTKIFDNRD